MDYLLILIISFISILIILFILSKILPERESDLPTEEHEEDEEE